MYGFLIAFAIFVSLHLAEKAVERKGLNKDLLWQGSFWTILFGIIGARLYHVLDFWEIYSANPVGALQVWNGGMGIFGALLGGGIALFIFLRSRNQTVWDWLDVIAMPLPLAQAIGRWGNYFNNELLPYALYESGADLVLFLILLRLNEKPQKPGKLFLIYLAGYSIIRFLLEPMREISWHVAGFNVAQTLSVLLLLASTATLFKWTRKRN